MSWLVPCMGANRVCVNGWMRSINVTALWIKALYKCRHLPFCKLARVLCVSSSSIRLPQNGLMSTEEPHYLPSKSVKKSNFFSGYCRVSFLMILAICIWNKYLYKMHYLWYGIQIWENPYCRVERNVSVAAVGRVPPTYNVRAPPVVSVTEVWIATG